MELLSRLIIFSLCFCLCYSQMSELAFQRDEYVGCYKDTANRDLGGELINFPLDNTPHKCISLCKDKGYSYSSVQASDWCLCGDSYGKYGPLPESSCNLACTGDQSLLCGGRWANAVYRITLQDEYVGCYKDTVNRDLGGELINFPLDNTPHKCISLCKDKGYSYSSVQASDWCLCGDSYGKYGPLPESSCNLACTGDQSLLCGGRWANAVYRITLQETCPTGWKPYKSSCHLIPNYDTQKQSWEDAEEYCKGRGGHLVKINDQEEMDHLSNLLPSSVLPWIGLNDKDVEGNFVWVSDNSPVDYSYWERGDPNNAEQGEHCVLIWTRDHKWADAPCGWHRRPLCEQPLYKSIA